MLKSCRVTKSGVLPAAVPVFTTNFESMDPIPKPSGSHLLQIALWKYNLLTMFICGAAEMMMLCLLLRDPAKHIDFRLWFERHLVIDLSVR